MTISNYSWESPMYINGWTFSPRQEILINKSDDSETDLGIIFRGNADDNGKIDIWPIVSQYLTTTDLFRNFVFSSFRVYSYDNLFIYPADPETGDELAGLRLIGYNWSYNKDYIGNESQCLNKPIRYTYVKGQYQTPSYRNMTATNYVMSTEWGVVFPAYKNSVASIQLSTSYSSATKSDDWNTYNVLDACGQIVIYYVNDIGGIDSFVCRDVHTKTAQKKMQYINKEYNTIDPYRHSQERYVGERMTTYTVNTGNLTDYEASRMDEIFLSPMIWMQKIGEDEVPKAGYIPDSSIQLQSYLNQGKRIPRYEFEIKTNNKVIR